MKKETILTAIITAGLVSITTTEAVTLKAARLMIENYLTSNQINFISYANVDTITSNDGITTIYANIETA